MVVQHLQVLKNIIINKFSYEYSYDYIIVYYSGSHNDGNLYVTSDDTNLFLDDAALSTVSLL